jgi:DNA repair exonuclease SbcCD ATPase subunit
LTDVAALPFDQYQRYRLASDLLDEVRPKGTTWSVLDVGGRTALLRSFLPRDRVVPVDLEASSERPLVLGDGSALPFADASFDVVAAFDTLEHVPVGRREAFVAECRRVARRYVMLVGPYQSPEVEEAERILQQFLRDKLAVEHRYLEEHRHNGLPDRGAVEAELAKLGASVVSIGHGNLERWLALISLSMYMDYRPELRGIASRFHRFYNEKLYASDHAAPVYRHAVVASLANARLPTPARHQAAPIAPPGAVERIRELAFEIVAFERERAAFEEERARLRKVAQDLGTDLAGHRTSLTEARAIQAQQSRVIGTLTKDLEGHKRSMGDLERELALVRQTFEREVAEHKNVIASQERELAAAREAFEGSLREHQAVIAALQADLTGHRGHVANLEHTIGELTKGVEDLRAELGRAVETIRARDELVALLRSELRNRWHNLKRALGPKRPTP